METPTIKEEFESFIKKIIKPKLLKTLTPISIHITRGDSEIILETYPFFTISDLKLAIYEKFNSEDYAAPNNQLIYLVKGQGVEPIDFTWKTSLLKNPKDDIINSNFINPDGSRRNIPIVLNDNILLENKLKTNKINLLFYRDVEKYIVETRPLSEKTFNGRLYPYFPFLKNDTLYPTEADLRILSLKLEYITSKFDYINTIDTLLGRGDPLIEPVFAGMRFLKLTWPINPVEESIESIFYDIDVNPSRPYLRLLSSTNNAISKVHLIDVDNKIPNIFDINYLSKWSEEKNPTPERNFIIGKIALNCTILDVPYIYGTLRLLDDGSFDVIVEPPKNIRKLHFDSDFSDFEGDFIKGIDKINRNNILPSISSGNFIFGLKLSATSAIITKKQFEKRLSLFKPIFQEISPLPNEQPFYMLRYKIVNNFTTEDNIYSFLTQLMNKKIVKGDESVSEMINYVSEEFQIDLETARQKVSDWLTKRDEVQQILIGESKEYTPFNNTGVDISIFQYKNAFTFHLYNVDSFITLERIISSLSLILSLPEIDLKVSDKKTKEFEALEMLTKSDVSEESTPESAEDSGDASSLPDYEDDLMFDNSDSVSLEETTREIKDKITNDKQLPNEELKQVKFEKEKKTRVATTEDTTKGVANFFIQKLKEIDNSLFDFPTKHPSDLGYVQACAANEMRQPAALTREQYDDMIVEYEEDEVDFRVYPPNEGEDFEEPSKTDNPDNIITVLRYRNNFYVCSELFCTRDEIVVLKKDFVGTRLRREITEPDGTVIDSKPANTCPFCLGKLIVNRKNPGVNETVLQRLYKPKTTKRHVWVNFLKKSSHPSGWQLPCCFVSPSPIQFKDLGKGEFEKYKSKKVEDEEEDEFIPELEKNKIYPYTLALSRIQKKYIVGDVIPLGLAENNEPQIGLLPKQLDELFQQDPATLVGRFGNLQKILPNAKGFLRIGVENRKRFQGDSFLAAVAPFFGKNSASEMKQTLLNVIIPKIFVTLNYGNLMLEFYSPTDKTLPKQRLEKWAKEELNVNYSDDNALEIERIYKSYNAFTRWLISEDTIKEYRQFAMIFSQSSLVQQGVSRSGITFIVIDMNEDNTISIRCPSYGYNTDIQTNNDVAFLFHHYSGIWEPLFYVNNIVTTLTVIDPYTLRFNKKFDKSWPNIVTKLVAEYSKICSGPGRTVYTSQTKINPDNLIPLSYAKTILFNISEKYPNFSISGILRDSYNHVSAIVCEEERADKNYQVLLPVIDDGILVIEKLYLNYEEIKLESFENTVRIYNKYLLPFLVRYTGYKPVAIAKNSSSQEFVAIILKNRLTVPIKPSTTVSSDTKQVTISDFEWTINRAILFDNEEQALGLNNQILAEREINEIYEHLRITFGNFVAKYGSSFKERLDEDIINRIDLSLNDKRRRMMLLLGNIVLSWFSTEKSNNQMLSVLRKDCTIQNESTCSDKCVWLEESGCKIHIKERYKKVNMGNLLMLRLFDEILRYSQHRREIFKNKVSRLVFLNEPIFIKDQYIIPENSLEWSELLRSGSVTRKSEASKFFEEFSSGQLTEKEEDDELFELPLNVSAYLELSDKSKFKFLVVTEQSSLNPILDYLGTNSKDIKYDGISPSFTPQQLNEINKDKSVYIIQINTLIEPFNIRRFTVVNNKNRTIILLITKDKTGFIVKNSSSIYLNYSDIPTIILPQ